MFQTTLPAADVVSRLMGEAASDASSAGGPTSTRDSGPATVSSTLSPSMLSDLQRFLEARSGLELLPVLAASLRHARPIAMRLELDGAHVLVTIEPRQQLYRASLPLHTLQPTMLSRFRLVLVEPDPVAESRKDSADDFRHVGPLRVLLWQLALHGARGDLLPEVAGRMKYRVAIGVSLTGLPIETAMIMALRRLRHIPSSIKELCESGLLDREALQRLINALYLQSALIVTRSVLV